LQVIGSAGGTCTDSDDLQITVNQGSASTQNISGLNSLTLNGQTYTNSGTYTQVIPNQAGCDSTITLNLTMNYTGIEENNSNYISIFPNPTTTNVAVTIPKEMIGQRYTLVSATGKVLADEIIKHATTTINLDQLAQGTYFLQIGTLKNPSKIVKL
jgi:hypothetical protein